MYYAAILPQITNEYRSHNQSNEKYYPQTLVRLTEVDGAYVKLTKFLMALETRTSAHMSVTQPYQLLNQQ